jgi:hypothetical protein
MNKKILKKNSFHIYLQILWILIHILNVQIQIINNISTPKILSINNNNIYKITMDRRKMYSSARIEFPLLFLIITTIFQMGVIQKEKNY